MTVLRILRDNAPELRKVSVPVTAFGVPDTKRLIDDMLETMQANDGVGLAAPQVGKNIRIIVVSTGHLRLGYFINPVIVYATGQQRSVEGCLSVDKAKWNQPVLRALRIRVRSQGLDGDFYESKARGLLAAVLQHEIDHLNGVLFLDRLKDARPLEVRPVPMTVVS